MAFSVEISPMVLKEISTTQPGPLLSRPSHDFFWRILWRKLENRHRTSSICPVVECMGLQPLAHDTWGHIPHVARLSDRNREAASSAVGSPASMEVCAGVRRYMKIRHWHGAGEGKCLFSPTSCSPLIIPCPCSELKWLVMLTVNTFVSLAFQWGTPPES